MWKRSPQRGDCGGWKMECQTMFIIEETVEERFSDNDVDTWGSSDNQKIRLHKSDPILCRKANQM